MIAELTKGCPREDCCLTGGGGTSTCMGWMPTFDKRGNRIDMGDPNIFTVGYSCMTCGSSWTVKTQRGETTITKHDKAA